jgi:uncharacterized protein YhbP (UPF0306 family)
MNLQFLTQKYLTEGQTMQLAASVNDQPWVVSVYFVYYQGRVYWLSFPSRRHSQEVAINKAVAATIVIKVDRPVIGVEFAGHAEIIEDPETVQEVMRHYIEKYGEGEKFYDNFVRGTNKHKLYCFELNEIVLFDEVHFPDNGRQVVL